MTSRRKTAAAKRNPPAKRKPPPSTGGDLDNNDNLGKKPQAMKKAAVDASPVASVAAAPNNDVVASVKDAADGGYDDVESSEPNMFKPFKTEDSEMMGVKPSPLQGNKASSISSTEDRSAIVTSIEDSKKAKVDALIEILSNQGASEGMTNEYVVKTLIAVYEGEKSRTKWSGLNFDAKIAVLDAVLRYHQLSISFSNDQLREALGVLEPPNELNVDNTPCSLQPDFLTQCGLVDYVNAAKECAGKADVEDTFRDLEAFIFSPVENGMAAPFASIFAPSGTGKTQLAATAALERDVTYLYVGNPTVSRMQPFYRPHAPVWKSLLGALQDFLSPSTDTRLFGVLSSELTDRGAHGILTHIKKDAVCVLFGLLSTLLFGGPPGYLTLTQLRKQVLDNGSRKMVFLDEVPKQEDRWFNEFIALRNVLRAIGICPILMSTNTGAQNAVGMGGNSRLGDPTLWCRILVKLPVYHGKSHPLQTTTERPLIAGLLSKESSNDLTSLVRNCCKFLQDRKPAAWKKDPAFQLCQLFRVKGAEDGEHVAAHRLVGQHFANFCLQDQAAFKDIDRSDTDLHGWRIRMVVPENEPVLFLALTSWKVEDITAANNFLFPLVDKYGNTISVREAFNKSSDEFRSNIYKANPAALKLEGDDLEIVALGSVTLASLQCDNGVSVGVELAQFVSSVFHFMLPGKLEKDSLLETTHELEQMMAFLSQTSTTIVLPAKVPACAVSDSTIRQWPQHQFGKLTRPSDKEMRDGYIKDHTGETVVHIECKNLQAGMDTETFKKVIHRIRHSVNVCLLFTSDINSTFTKEEAWLKLTDELGLGIHGVCFLVLKRDMKPYWLQVGKKANTTLLSPKAETTHLAIIIATGAVATGAL